MQGRSGAEQERLPASVGCYSRMTHNSQPTHETERRENSGKPGSIFRALGVGLALLATMAARSRTPVAPQPADLRQPSTNAVARDSKPAESFSSIVWRIYEAADQDRVMLVAAGVTYYALLALFPAIAALVSLFGLFADPSMIKQQLAAGQDVLPGSAIEIIGDQISRIQASGGRTLGVYFFVGLGISLWSANAGVKAIFDALNAVHGANEKRSFLAYNLQALAFTLGTILFLMLAVGAIIVMPAVFAFFGLRNEAGWALSLLRWPLLLVFTLLFLALLYRFGPSRDHARWHWITWGSVSATVLWLAGSMLFSWYVANFGTFNETYGSLGAVIGFMVWIWISALIVLVGAEIDAELERRDSVETA